MPHYTVSLISHACSIPHASPGNGHNGPHQPLSISPTNSTSPVNRESGLAHNENTQVPQETQIQESDNVEGETTETVVETDDAVEAKVKDTV